jgi:hypothetical protein
LLDCAHLGWASWSIADREVDLEVGIAVAYFLLEVDSELVYNSAGENKEFAGRRG